MCSYDVISGVFGCGHSKHQDQRHDGGEPGQGGDLRDHLHTHTHTLNYTGIMNQETHTHTHTHKY